MDKKTLDKINALTRRKFKAEELYTFPVVLCHNDVDRDYERFSDDALDEMAELFVGKTGIFDHNPTADNQSARIYDTEVVTDPDKETAWGGAYRYLKGYAYMVRTDKNADLITEIDAGIKKEVSVSCSAQHRVCSVCGADLTAEPCGHQKGHEYDGATCCHVLDGITDAYEWSFVAVPAQVGAGVTKARSPRGQDSPNAADAAKVEYITKRNGGRTMADKTEFQAITTQADFDAAVQPLIDAAVKAKAAEFEGWISPEEHQKALEDLNADNTQKLMGAYRTKAALMAGLPAELADRLTGDTEEALQKDAEKLAGFTKSTATPHFTAGGGEMDEVEKCFYERNKNLYPN